MTATRSRSKWLRIGGGVLLLILALLLVPFVVPVDRFRPLLVRLVEDTTGRTVEIQALRLRLLPTVHLQVVNLRVKHPPGFPPGDTLTVRSVDIGTTLRSLLARRPEVTSIALNGVRANLLVGPGGTTNYQIATGGGQPAGAAARGAPVFALGRIDSVTARDVAITSGVYDPRRGVVTPSFAIAGVNAQLRGIDLSAPDWFGKMEVAANMGGMTVSTPALSKPLRFQKGSVSLKASRVTATFAASLDPLSVSGTVTVASLRNPVADFDVAVPELDLDRLKTLVKSGGAVPGGGLPGGPRRLLARGTVKIAHLVARPLEVRPVTGRIVVYSDQMEVAADLGGMTVSTPALSKPLRFQKGSVSLKADRVTATFAASVDPLSVSGTVTVASLKDPVADFDIAIPELDLDRLKTLVKGDGAVPGGSLPGGPHRLLARGTVKIAHLVARPLEVGLATGRIVAYSDRLEVDPYSLALYGGTIQGAASVDAAAAHLPAQVTMKARGVDFARAEKAVAPAAKQRITGTLEADAHLALALGGDPLASLNGAGTFAVRNGTLPNLDIGNTLATVAQIVRVNIPAGPTKFQYFGGDFRIAQQRVYSEALKLEAEDLQATGRGSAGFDRTLDYTGTGVITGSIAPAQPGTPPSFLGTLLGTLGQSGGTVTARVPFTLRGTFDDPKFSASGMPQLSPGPTSPQPHQPARPGENPLNLLPFPIGP